jgi:hypothetical protein
MLVESVAIGAGLIVTQLLGWSCGYFLKKSVPVKQELIPDLQKIQADGGGEQLGAIECLLFFASFSLGQYAMAGGWLGFKVTAKWAAWQHIVKIPAETGSGESLKQRNLLSSYLLGRFLNGTLYNALCAGVGAIIAKVLETSISQLFSESALWSLAVAMPIIIVSLAVYSLFNSPRSAE